MTTRPETIKQSELLNQLVLNRSTMEELGRIEVIWMYPDMHRVLGFVCKTGLLGNRKLAFKLAQLDAFGSNGVLTHSPPEETDADRVRQLESLVQSEVWTDTGERVGKVIDYIFTTQTGYITDYLVVTDGLVGITSNVYRLSPSKVIGLGRKRVLISEDTADNLPIYRESVRQKLTKTGDFLKEDVTQELRSLVEQAQSVTQQARDRWFSLREQVKEQAFHLSQQTKETLESLNYQLQERTQDWADFEQEDEPRSSSPWCLQALKQAEDENFTTVPVEAEEIPDLWEEPVEELESVNSSINQDQPIQLQSGLETLSQPEVASDNESEEVQDVDDVEFWSDEYWADVPSEKSYPSQQTFQHRPEQIAFTSTDLHEAPAPTDLEEDDEPWI